MNRHDWLKALGLLGLGATGFGLAGMGPLAALGAGAKGATLAAGMAGPTTAGAGGLLGAGATLGQAMPAMGAAAKIGQSASGLLGPSAPNQQPLIPPPPQPTGPMPLPGSSYGGSDMPPPGVDPNQWAQMSPEQKKALMAQRGMT